MLPAREVMEEIPFPDVLDNRELPITLEVSVDCKLYGKTVLEQGQRITVLDRSNLDVLCGRDWKNNKVRLGKRQVLDYQLDIVEELYPTSIEELRSMIEKCSFIQARTEFKDDLHQFECFETFQFSHFLDDTCEGVVIITSDGISCIDSCVLLNSDHFVLVRVKEVTNVRDFIRNFKDGYSSVICFRDTITGMVLPLGNMLIQSIVNYEIAYTVTAINGDRELKYETFPIDKRILFRRVRIQQVPQYVKVFGAYNSNEYCEKLGVIKSLMNYEFHSPRFYAFLIIENHTFSPPTVRENTYSSTFQRPADLDLKTTVYSSIRRGLNKLKKRSSSIEDLNIKPKLISRNSDSSILCPTLPGVYKPMDKHHDSIAEINHTDERVRNNSNEHLELAPRSSSDPLDSQQTLIATDNLVYNIDTLAIEELKKKGQKIIAPTPIKSKPLNNEQRRKKVVKPTRPVSFDTNMVFPMDLVSSTQGEYEKPFNQQSPFGRPTHIKDEEIKYRRSPSMPTRTLAQNMKRPIMKSRSLSPRPLPIIPVGDLDGMDSGVDSPDDQHNLKQLARSFQEEAENARLRSRSDLVGSDLDISWPYNFEHVTKTQKQALSPLYDIPRRRLRESMNFPNLKHMKLQRCRSEPVLDDHTTSHKEVPVYEEPNYDFIKGIPEAEIDIRLRMELESIRQIKTYSIQQMVQLLVSLNLKKHVRTFKKQLINGALLLKLTEEELRVELGMTSFEARKIYKYAHGWRPIVRTPRGPDEVKMMDRAEWGYLDVQNQMQVIKLSDFGKFCSESLIDGVLLLDLQRNDLIPTLKEDGIHLNNIEIRRLYGYLNKEVLYEKDAAFLG